MGLFLALAVAGFVVGAGSLCAQTVTVGCEEAECDVVPIAGGRGGFVGRTRAGVDKVDVMTVCLGASTQKVVERELDPGPDGVMSTVQRR